MRRLRVTPADRAGRRFVTGTDGRTLAWYDRDAGRVSLLRDDDAEAVLAALRPYLTGSWTVGPPPVPTAAELARLALHPDDDLAPNRPGELLLGALEHGTAGARTRLRLRAHLQARQCFGAELDTLEGAGWRVLHDVLLPGGAVIDHLLIGPGGVLAVRTAPARRKRAAVGELLLTVGRAEPVPDPRWARRTAARAGRALATEVAPALAVIDATEVTVSATQRDLRVLREGAAPALARLAATLKPAETATLYAAARDRRTWAHC
ncbi:NERD domain-containing protein [Streptomyces bambusae]|uniref:nuclease-related domain-containing protein n=1 Tax=Streptomyces bambusae TaxID=1550616 RepID=UPI001CFD6730|nr:nuclease-related domain-containing protein [Streptomyces bambusae]MCB5165124.1 NERD domain-containing protein [Streptomyces bambusae]